MSNRTTADWEALLDGTTARPWVIGATLKDPLVDVSAKTYEDAHLLAAAPEAVAEVVRLRTELAELRDYLDNFDLDLARGDYEYGQYTAPVEPSGDADHAPWWFYLGDQVVGTSGSGDVGIQHTVVIHDEDGSPVHSERWIDLSPEDARNLAAILLTAAAHAQKEETNE